MVLVLGVLALLVVAGGISAVIVLARRQAKDEESPMSEPTDFVAPVSSGGYSFRKTDETLDEFHARIARENAQGAASRIDEKK